MVDSLVITCPIHGELDIDDVEESVDGTALCKYCSVTREVNEALNPQ